MLIYRQVRMLIVYYNKNAGRSPPKADRGGYVIKLLKKVTFAK